MKKAAIAIVMGMLLLASEAVCAYAQQKSDSGSSSSTSTTATTPAATPSLGDLARKMKADKPKDSKPAKVFTNDNIPKGNVSEVSSSSGGSDAASSTSATTGSVHDEKYYRAQMSKLQGQLDTDQRELDVMQQKLGQGNMQYYSNPQTALMQEYSRSDINKLNDDISAKKDQIAKDQQAIDDLRDQLRREGGDPGWLR